jgi:hypothetical protein
MLKSKIVIAIVGMLLPALLAAGYAARESAVKPAGQQDGVSVFL